VGDLLTQLFSKKFLGLLLIGASLMGSAGTLQAAYRVMDLDVFEGDGGVVITITADAPVIFGYFAIGGSKPRLVIDLSDALHGLPKYRFDNLGTTLISSIRASQYRPYPQPSVRVVFDMPELLPFQIWGEHNRLVIFLERISGISSVVEVSDQNPPSVALQAEAKAHTPSTKHDQAAKGAVFHQSNPAGENISFSSQPDKGASSRLLAWAREGAEAKESITVEENQLFEGIVKPILVVADNLDEGLTLKDRIDRDQLASDPSCLNQDIFMYMQKNPLINAGLFSSQISVNGNRPEDTQIEIDRVLRVYDWGKIQNVFGILDSDIFEAQLNRFGYRANGGSGFSRIDVTTNPRKSSRLSLRFFDFSALANFDLLNSNLVTLGKISWLDQVINRIFGQGFVCPHSQELYSKLSFGPKRWQTSSNVWWLHEGSYIRSGVLTDSQIKRSYQTEADWLNEKELRAFWINNEVILSSRLFLELALSLYDTHRFDYARGKSGMVGLVDPTELYVDLDFSTQAVSSLMELSYFAEHLEVNSGIRVSKIRNIFSYNSEGYFYPRFYASQRGDEISPEEIKDGYSQDNVLESGYWTNVNTEVLGLGIMAGLTGSMRTGYPFGLSPRVQISYPLSISFLYNSGLILSLGAYRQFPGAERVYVTMYPVSESKGKAEESALVALGFQSDQFHLVLSGSKIRHLYCPGYANSRFSSVYANGYTAVLETGLKNRIGRITTELVYGYGISVNDQEGLEYRSVHDPGHNATLSVLYRPNEKFVLAATGEFSEGQRINRVIAREMTSEGYRPIWDPIPNSDRLPAKLGISIGGRLSLSDELLLSVYVVNFPGHTYAVMYQGWDPEKRSDIKYPFLVGLGIERNF